MSIEYGGYVPPEAEKGTDFTKFFEQDIDHLTEEVNAKILGDESELEELDNFSNEDLDEISTRAANEAYRAEQQLNQLSRDDFQARSKEEKKLNYFKNLEKMANGIAGRRRFRAQKQES